VVLWTPNKQVAYKGSYLFIDFVEYRRNRMQNTEIMITRRSDTERYHTANIGIPGWANVTAYRVGLIQQQVT
jgi:hypothetical protein